MNLRKNDRTVLTYDGSTVVEYQGQRSYNPEDLEVGDQIEAQVERSGIACWPATSRWSTAVW